MTKQLIRAGASGLAFALGLTVLMGPLAAKTASPEETCQNPLLTFRQKYLCNQELEGIQTKSDEKKVVRKFQDLIKAAEKAKEEAEK